ncbi:MAG TPA: DUF1844 domain-containing protein [Terriglobales bacterium]|jgi:hypothetical protein|nr:DUF1844 domain-containing protein [Terriglobales bacterium]
MPDKEKKPDFVVTDRRLFSTDGELRQDVVEAEEQREEREREKREAQQRANQDRAAQNHVAQPSPAHTATSVAEPEMQAPSAKEQQASAAAYKESTREIDAEIEKEMRKQGQPHRAQDFQITFEKFIASLYMTSLMQLGLAAPQGEKPAVDLIGARQTIDTVALLHEKTKGNLTPAEENMLQNILYELRMAYLEVTNLITRPPQGAPGDGKTG